MEIQFESSNETRAQSSEMGSSRLFTIKQFCSAFPWPSEAAMRAYVYRSDELGINEAFVRVGRRVLVDSKKFFNLIKQIESRPNKGDLNETIKEKRGVSQ